MATKPSDCQLCNEPAGLQPYIEYFVGTHCPSD